MTTASSLDVNAPPLKFLGCDTLTDTSLWTMLYLCIHTEVQDKMQQEIDNLIPDGDVNILDLKPQLHYTSKFDFSELLQEQTSNPRQFICYLSVSSSWKAVKHTGSRDSI